MKKTIHAALSLLATALLATTGVAQTTYDIGTASTVTFIAGDSLTNTGGITDWDSATQLAFTEGSDLSGVDFTALGITSWSFSTDRNTDNVIDWSGANFSGLSVTLAGSNNQLRNDTFVGTDFSNATINSDGNQPFVTASGGTMDLTNVNFSGATFNIGPEATTLGFAAYDTTGLLTGADFTNTVWNYTGIGNIASFSMGPGSTSTADMDLAADFSGADFSGVDNDNPEVDSFVNIVTNLGLFDGDTAIGAKYDASTVLPAGYTTADLDAVGWQGPGGISVVGDFTGDGIVDCDDLDGYVGNIDAAATGALAALDLDTSGFLDATDADTHVRTLVLTTNGITGTIPGDANCDGTVNVLGDAFILVANLGEMNATSYGQGDFNFDGQVNVLGDAFILVGNLGTSNTP